jgi:hypothetical protein
MKVRLPKFIRGHADNPGVLIYNVTVFYFYLAIVALAVLIVKEAWN